MTMPVSFGRPDEQSKFVELNSLFFERFPHLQAALEIGFLRECTSTDLSDMVIFFLGRVSVEDFMEILLLCGNGYGTGARKLLRGMYERVVTARFLHAHPEEVRNFIDFYWVNAYKVAKAIENVFGKGQLSAAKFDELATKHGEVVSWFLVTDCKKCGTQRVNHTWSKLDFVSMARATGATGNRIVDAYYLHNGTSPQYVWGHRVPAEGKRRRLDSLRQWITTRNCLADADERSQSDARYADFTTRALCVVGAQ
jgi:Family of unknown function (DUF5677)